MAARIALPEYAGSVPAESFELYFYSCYPDGMERIDPLLCDFDLSLSGTFYPVGFPLHIATNSPHVLAAAGESWAPFRGEFDAPPMDFRILVEPTGELAAEPTFRKQNHLLSFVSDAHNFAAGDSLTMSASFHLSETTAANHSWLRWLYLESMAYMLLTQRYVVSLHAACVADAGGILLCGKSGCGKSTLSFACARAGFTYVSDDCTWLLNGSEDHLAIGKPHQFRFRHDVARHFPELAGFVASAHPNGKLAIEAPSSVLPGVRTASRCSIHRLVFPDRESGGPARLDRVRPEDAAAALLAELPSYGPQVNALHEETIHCLTRLPAWRLHYRALDDAIRLLSELST